MLIVHYFDNVFIKCEVAAAAVEIQYEEKTESCGAHIDKHNGTPFYNVSFNRWFEWWRYLFSYCCDCRCARFHTSIFGLRCAVYANILLQSVSDLICSRMCRFFAAYSQFVECLSPFQVYLLFSSSCDLFL